MIGDRDAYTLDLAYRESGRKETKEWIKHELFA